jgi:hypothetical protein
MASIVGSVNTGGGIDPEVLALKADIESPNFSGTVVLPPTTTYYGSSMETLLPAAEYPLFIEERTGGTLTFATSQQNYPFETVVSTFGTQPYTVNGNISFVFNESVTMDIKTEMIFGGSILDVFCELRRNSQTIASLFEVSSTAGTVITKTTRVTLNVNDSLFVSAYRTTSGTSSIESGKITLSTVDKTLVSLWNSQSLNSFSIGHQASEGTQASNSIIVNATGVPLTANQPNSFYIKPVRATGVNSHILSYNDTTSEIVKSTPAQLETVLTGKANLSLLTGNTVKIGSNAGATSQGANSVAIGSFAAVETQGTNCVALGRESGKTSQGGGAVAIGVFAGLGTQGANSIAIGFRAGQSSQAANSIVLNATGATLNNTVENSFVVKPVRDLPALSLTNYRPLFYNTTSGEIVNNNNMFYDGGGSLIHYLISTAGGVNLVLDRDVGDGSTKPHLFFRRGATGVGTISTTTTSTIYGETSDYRLKNVIGEITDASARVLALKPIRFQWKSTGQEVDGFLAHEVQEVVPQSVTGVKDGVNAEGNPEYQCIDQSKLVPLLVASLQDALKRIAVLETLISQP